MGGCHARRHVEIVLTKEPEGRREGKIVKILERGISKVVGLL